MKIIDFFEWKLIIIKMIKIIKIFFNVYLVICEHNSTKLFWTNLWISLYFKWTIQGLYLCCEVYACICLCACSSTRLLKSHHGNILLTFKQIIKNFDKKSFFNNYSYFLFPFVKKVYIYIYTIITYGFCFSIDLVFDNIGILFLNRI